MAGIELNRGGCLRYERLGRPGNDNIEESIAVISSGLEDELESFRESPSQFGLECLIADCLDTVVFHHFGFAVPRSVEELLAIGCAIATPYFSGAMAFADQRDLDRARKVDGNSKFKWFELYRDTMQLALLRNDTALLSLLAKYAQPWFGTGWHYPEELNADYAYFLLSVGIAIDGRGLESSAFLRGKLEGDEDPVCRSLTNSWLLLLQNNADGFCKSFVIAMLEFEARLTCNITNSSQAIAFYHSIAFNTAQLIGVDVTSVTSDRLLTRSSIGI